MIRRDFALGTYTDISPLSGRIVTSRQGDVEYDGQRIPFGVGDGLLRYIRINSSGTAFAGVSSTDRVYMWDGSWHDVASAFGPNPLVYRGDELLVRDTPGAHGITGGIRAVDAAGGLVDDDATRSNGVVWEFTPLASCTVGQGNKGPHGEDPLVILYQGVRRLLDEGQCRFVRAYEEAGALYVAWWNQAPTGDGAPASMGSAAKLSFDDVRNLPVALEAGSGGGSPVPVPVPDEIRLPAEVQATITAVFPLVKDLHAGSDEHRRLGQRKIIEQVVFSHPGQGYGWKASSATNPPSKDAIAQLIGERLYIIDLVDGSTRLLADLSGPLKDVTGQHFIAIAGVDYLGTPASPPGAPTEPPKPPGAPKVCPDVEKLSKELADAFSGILVAMAGLLKRTEALELGLLDVQTAPMPPLVVRGTTGSRYGHSHTLDLEVVSKSI